MERDSKCDVLKITPLIQHEIENIFRTNTEWDDIFNVLLVYTCVRRAYYADQMTKQQKKLIKSVIKILNRSKLKPKLKYRNVKGRNIVYLDPELDKMKELNDLDLARLLGFHCIGHDYGNQDLHRLGLMIWIEGNKKRFSPYAEVCVVDEKNAIKQYKAIEQFMINKTAQYGKVADLFGFTASYQIQDVPGKLERANNLKNNEYIEKHFDQYYDDIWNNFTKTTRFSDMDNNAIVKMGLLELFKFEHWTSTGLELYEELFEFGTLSDEEHMQLTQEQKESLVEGPEKLLRDFEFDLMAQPELLKLKYDKWLDSPIFKQLVKIKYPELVPLFV